MQQGAYALDPLAAPIVKAVYEESLGRERRFMAAAGGEAAVYSSEKLTRRLLRLWRDQRTQIGVDPDPQSGFQTLWNGPASERAITLVCALGDTHDGLVAGVIGGAEGKVFGHAMRHLFHFFGGSGADLHIDLSLLLAEDSTVKERVFERLSEAQRDLDRDLEQGRKPTQTIKPREIGRRDAGTIHLVKPGGFANKDWLSALGDCGLEYKLTPRGRVARLTLEKEYTWHPAEPRNTQCFHQQAQLLIDRGLAKEFWMVGDIEIEVPQEV
jgi:hypothetical protein